jgi:hypothetical protein
MPVATRFAMIALLVAVPHVAAETGTLTGSVATPQAVRAIVAIDRKTDKKFPGTIDSATGKFTVAGVPRQVPVDLIIDHGKARLEGVNLAVKRSDYEIEQPMSADDVGMLKQTMKDLNKFENEHEFLVISGNIQHAAILINKRRTTPFYLSKPGEIIWRLELWHFEKPDETWIKSQDALFLTMYRERLPREQYDQKSLMLDARLGGLRLDAEQATIDLGTIELPDGKPGIRFRNPPPPPMPPKDDN